jgi:hypothetical protein
LADNDLVLAFGARDLIVVGGLLRPGAFTFEVVADWQTLSRFPRLTAVPAA